MKSNLLPIIFAISALSLWSIAPTADGTHPPPPTQTSEAEPAVGRETAHQYMIRGDQARDRRQWAEAIRSYQTALEIFRALGAEASPWEQDYFSFRTDYCQREIRLIERQTGRTAEAWLEMESSLTTADAQRYRDLYYAVSRENRRLRQRVEELEDDLELMLEMEELERQREEARRRQPSPERADEDFAEDSETVERGPEPLHAPQAEPTTAPPQRPESRRRAPHDPVLRR